MQRVLKWTLPVIQAVLSAIFMFILVRSGLLPGKYMGIALTVVTLLLLVSALFARSESRVVRSLGNILAIFMCGMLVFGMVYINQVMKTLNKIAGSDTELKRIAVIVADNNAASSIEETKGYRFGVYEGTDREQIETTIEEIKRSNMDIVLTREDYDSPITMAQALIGGEIDAAICNKAYKEVLDEVIVDFSSDSRFIFEKEFETKTSIEADVPGDSGVVQEQKTVPEKKKLTDHPFTVLISGIDVSGPISSTSRSDVNILMTVNPLTHKIVLTTTPRDYYVYISGISGDMRDKLTHAGIYGVKTSMKTLEDLYGVEISDYIRINFDSLVLLVDALGGIDVYSEYSFDTTFDEKSYSFYKGTNHLNGEEALAFSRERHSFDSGDQQRGKNQMLVLTAIIDKLQSPALLKNPSGVLEVVGKSMQTSFSTSEITDAISWQLDNGTDWDISRQSVIGTGDSQQTFSMQGVSLYVMWPDEDSVDEAAAKIEEVMTEIQE